MSPRRYTVELRAAGQSCPEGCVLYNRRVFSGPYLDGLCQRGIGALCDTDRICHTGVSVERQGTVPLHPARDDVPDRIREIGVQRAERLGDAVEGGDGQAAHVRVRREVDLLLTRVAITCGRGDGPIARADSALLAATASARSCELRFVRVAGRKSALGAVAGRGC